MSGRPIGLRLRAVAFVTIVALGTVAGACGGAGGDGGGSDAKGPRPDHASTTRRGSLLLLTLDTTRADHLEPYGGPAGATPNLASLAREGALFERVYAVAPVTLPAHATLFTGQDPTRHGVRNNGIHALGDDAVTLTEILHDHGFATAAFVSAAVLERRYGLAQGFDLYDDEPTSTRRALGRPAERPAGETVDRAWQWLDGLPAGKPFFLWVHFYDPHAVYAPPPPFADTWKEQPYLGEIAYMDSEIGRLLRHPRLTADTLIMAIGDHGESLGEHGEDNHGMLIYDATLRVPWIVRGPGIVAGLRLAAPASEVDLFPTVLDLLGARGPQSQGRSWAAALSGAKEDGAEPTLTERPLYSETLVPFLSYGWAPLHAVRRGDWKLIDGPSPELYDLASDPGELHDRIGDEKATARRLETDLAAIRAGDAGPRSAAPIDGEQAEKLRSLGYLSSVQPQRSDRALPDPKSMIGLHRRLGEAEEALLSGDPAAATVKLDAVLQSDPDNVTALEAQATALTRLGRLPQAEAVLERAMRLDPGRTSLELAAATLRANAGRPEQALELATLAAQRDPRSAEARLAVARFDRALHRDDEAAANARQAFELAPHSAVAEIVYADLVERRQSITAAEARLRRVVEREPLLPEAWLTLGSVVEEADGSAAATAIYQEGLERQPASGELHAALGVLLAQGQRPGAEEHLRRAAELLRPVPGSVERGLALVAIGRRDWKEAERAARRALAVSRDDAAAWTVLAAALEEQGRIDDALSAYDQAGRADASYPPAMFNRALLLRRLRRYEDAAKDLQRLLTLLPDHAQAHFELGVLYAGPLHDPRAARRELERALAAGHPDPDLVRRALAALPAA